MLNIILNKELKGQILGAGNFGVVLSDTEHNSQPKKGMRGYNEFLNGYWSDTI
jgi:hypothetical protein